MPASLPDASVEGAAAAAAAEEGSGWMLSAVELTEPSLSAIWLVCHSSGEGEASVCA